MTSGKGIMISQRSISSLCILNANFFGRRQYVNLWSFICVHPLYAHPRLTPL
jgi:hypothetical protein